MKIFKMVLEVPGKEPLQTIMEESLITAPSFKHVVDNVASDHFLEEDVTVISIAECGNIVQQIPDDPEPEPSDFNMEFDDDIPF